jgi:hypothetical protein
MQKKICLNKLQLMHVVKRILNFTKPETEKLDLEYTIIIGQKL